MIDYKFLDILPYKETIDLTNKVCKEVLGESYDSILFGNQKIIIFKNAYIRFLNNFDVESRSKRIGPDKTLIELTQNLKKAYRNCIAERLENNIQGSSKQYFEQCKNYDLALNILRTNLAEYKNENIYEDDDLTHLEYRKKYLTKLENIDKLHKEIHLLKHSNYNANKLIKIFNKTQNKLTKTK